VFVWLGPYWRVTKWICWSWRVLSFGRVVQQFHTGFLLRLGRLATSLHQLWKRCHDAWGCIASFPLSFKRY
jgi:hypothetical protein